MGYKCCVPGCDSGYKSSASKGQVTMFSFPHDLSLRRKWLRNIHRDFEVTDYSRVCHLHFREEDFEKYSTDCNDSRRNARSDQKLQYRKLKPCAIPSLHPNLPSYLSSKPSTSRGRSALSESRIMSENRIIQTQITEMNQNDSINNINDLRAALLYDHFIPVNDFEFRIS